MKKLQITAKQVYVTQMILSVLYFIVFLILRKTDMMPYDVRGSFIILPLFIIIFLLRIVGERYAVDWQKYPYIGLELLGVPEGKQKKALFISRIVFLAFFLAVLAWGYWYIGRVR